ncbi:PaaI family thioesterase [Brevibacillus sp. NRS-1366]|uniref:PaaI family thioesterase n=1 Tax=Brevibacillus sp. NRS-1366 TaxID=3233899 RepID=UPI003D22583F
MTEKNYTISDLVDVVRKGNAPPPCDTTLQVHAYYAEEGISRGRWEVSSLFINGNGVVMGGLLSAAADIMMAYAIASCLNDDQRFASINLQTTFHRPAFQGVVEIEARVERLGKSVAYLVADLTQDGKKVASSVSSVMIMEA